VARGRTESDITALRALLVAADRSLGSPQRARSAIPGSSAGSRDRQAARTDPTPRALALKPLAAKPDKDATPTLRWGIAVSKRARRTHVIHEAWASTSKTLATGKRQHVRASVATAAPARSRTSTARARASTGHLDAHVARDGARARSPERQPLGQAPARATSTPTWRAMARERVVPNVNRSGKRQHILKRLQIIRDFTCLSSASVLLTIICTGPLAPSDGPRCAAHSPRLMKSGSCA
jgi:hypothetical protein